MKRKGIKLIGKILVAAMAISCFAGLTSNDAAAAKVKLSKKSLTMKKGDEELLTVKGAGKKVKWSVTNKKVVKVTKVGKNKAIVKAKKEGKCKINAKVGKKKLICSVTVTGKKAVTGNNKTDQTPQPSVNTLSNSEMAAKMAVSVQPVAKSGTVLLTVTNNNNILIDSYKISYQFANAAGAAIDSGTAGGYAISAGATQYVVVTVGKEKAKTIDVNTSTVSTTVENYNYSHYADVSSELSVTLGQGGDPGKVPVTYVNSGATKNYVRGAALFTDVSGNIILAYSIYNSVDAGATKFDEISIPYEMDETGAYLKDETGQWYRVKYADKKVLFNAFKF